MIVYGACVANEAKYSNSVESIRTHCDPAPTLLRASTRTSIAEAYNQLLREVRELPDAEALVLMHEDVEILDHQFETKIRRILADRPAVGLIGAIGGRDVTSLRWWRGVVVGRVFETRGIMSGICRTGDVDAVDGFLMILSPAAFGELDFDEAISGFHGYDGDYCAQVRHADLAVTVAALDVAHHSKGGYGDLRAFRAANERWSEKWGYPKPRFARLDGYFSALGNLVWRAISPKPQRSQPGRSDQT